MLSPAYLKHLKSKRWANSRAQCLKRDGYKCVRCGSTKILQAHHLTYERLGNERLADLITLCRACHEREHGRRFANETTPARDIRKVTYGMRICGRVRSDELADLELIRQVVATLKGK